MQLITINLSPLYLVTFSDSDMATFKISRRPVESQWPKLPYVFQKAMLETRICDILSRDPSLIIAKSSDSVAQVFSRLIDNGILSVPLLNTRTNRYMAFLDIYDILNLVMSSVDIEQPEHQVEAAVHDLFEKTPCTELVGKGSRSWFDLVGEDAPVQTAINELRYVRRLAIVDHHANMVALITQSKVAHWLAKQEDIVLGPLASTPIGDLKLGYGEVVVAHHQEKAIRVFHRMFQLDVSGIAIVNDESAVIGNISITDLKDIGYSANMFSRLSMTCADFLEHRVEGLLHPNLISATPNTSVKELLNLFRQHRVHRIYVVSELNRAPLGVCTLTDIMNLFSIPPPEGDAPKSEQS